MLRPDHYHFSEVMRIRRAKVLAFGLLAVAAALLFGLLAANPARSAATFTVNSTGDGGDSSTTDNKCFTGGFVKNANGVFEGACTLRAAIQQANATAGADTINFNIPDDPNITGFEVKTITPGSELPEITDQVTIDGYTQTGASENTLTGDGTNAVLKIELDGTNAGNIYSYKPGLIVQGSNASNSVIRGLVINRFKWSGINIRGDGTGVKIEGNFIGTDPSGTIDRGNGGGGVLIDTPDVSDPSGPDHTVGGTAPGARNLISANGIHGVWFQGSTGNRIEGNLIGTKSNGTEALGNGSAGVRVGFASNTILANNTIAFNGWDGVEVSNGFGNRILSNSIHSNGGLGTNGGLGIDLQGNTGVTPNDKKDRDAGSNRLQNYPVITSAVTGLSTGDTKIQGRLNSTPRKKFTIQIFSSSEADPLGFGEGEVFLGQKTVKTNEKGKASFAFTVGLSLGQDMITATATRNSTGDTSEFSEAVVAVD